MKLILVLFASLMAQVSTYCACLSSCLDFASLRAYGCFDQSVSPDKDALQSTLSAHS